jgi:tRNA threonylcarbamoyladenosine biosynthesis protein TsaB
VTATLLAFDTSTMTSSAALLSGGRVVACDSSAVELHSENLIPLIDRVLRRASAKLADVRGIAVGLGPGSFTGLRIGLATAKGLCFAGGASLYGVSSLAALALDAVIGVGNAVRDRLLVPVVNAQRGEVFAGFYAWRGDHILDAIAEEQILEPIQLLSYLAELQTAHPQLSSAALLGDGVTAYPKLAETGLALADVPSVPSGAGVGLLALQATPLDLYSAAPTYLRPSDAEVMLRLGNGGERTHKK